MPRERQLLLYFRDTLRSPAYMVCPPLEDRPPRRDIIHATQPFHDYADGGHKSDHETHKRFRFALCPNTSLFILPGFFADPVRTEGS